MGGLILRRSGRVQRNVSRAGDAPPVFRGQYTHFPRRIPATPLTARVNRRPASCPPEEGRNPQSLSPPLLQSPISNPRPHDPERRPLSPPPIQTLAVFPFVALRPRHSRRPNSPLIRARSSPSLKSQILKFRLPKPPPTSWAFPLGRPQVMGTRQNPCHEQKFSLLTPDFP